MFKFSHAAIDKLIISGVLLFSTLVIPSVAHASRQCSVPSLDLISLDGNKVPLRKYEGKTMIVAFWTTWCSPCRTSELPGLTALRKLIPNTDFVILAISNDAQKQEIERYLKHPSIDFGVLEHNMFFDPDYAAYHTIIGQDVAEVHPYAVIFDRKGCMVETEVGAHDWLSLSTLELINGLLSND